MTLIYGGALFAGLRILKRNAEEVKAIRAQMSGLVEKAIKAHFRGDSEGEQSEAPRGFVNRILAGPERGKSCEFPEDALRSGSRGSGRRPPACDELPHQGALPRGNLATHDASGRSNRPKLADVVVS